MCICSHFLLKFQLIRLTARVVELMAYVLHARLEHLAALGQRALHHVEMITASA